MKILLTGATGFLGSHIAEQLSQQNQQIRCLIRPTAQRCFLKQLTNIEFCEGHLNDEVSLQQAVSGVEAVIHAAALVKARQASEFDSVNVGGTLKLLQAVQRYAPALKRFILISSLAAFGPATADKPLSEDISITPHPVSHYGRSKLAAEQLALTFTDKLPITIIRPPLIYGPRDKECLAFFRAVKYKTMPFFGTKQHTTSVIYCVDAAQAISCALQAAVPSGTAYFISDGVIYSNCAMISRLAQTMDSKLWLQPVLPFGILKIIALLTEQYGRLTNTAVMLTRDKVNELIQPHWICRSQKAQQELHWQPQIDWATGTQLTFNWYKENGWL